MTAAMANADFSCFVTRRDDRLDTMTVAIEGVGRTPEIGSVEAAARSVAGVAFARLNLSDLRLALRWRPEQAQAGAILAALESAGFKAYPLAPASAEDAEAAMARWLVSCLAVAGFAAMNVMLLSISVWSGNVSDITPETRDLFHWISAVIALPAAAYAGQPFFRSAIAGLRVRQMNMDVPISVGILLALGLSVVETARHGEHAYFDSAMMLLFFLLCGRSLDLAMRRRTRAFAGNLAALKGRVALKLDADDRPVLAPVAALDPGDRVLVRPGERCPVDGIVLDGASQVEEGLVTGETLPHAVGPGAAVHCGAMNGSGSLTLRVTAAGEDTLVAEVERLLGQALAVRSRYVRLADRVARLYAPVVHVTALATMIGWLLVGASLHDALVIAIAVLIITCPCALALAVPAVQVAAAGALFRRRILLNSADAIERLAGIDTIVFDKTGTLTLPEARPRDLEAVDPDLARLAARLALSSHHPLAVGLVAALPGGSVVPGAVEVPGEGVRAQIDGTEARLGSLAFCGIGNEQGQQQGSVIGFVHAGRQAVFHLGQRLRADAPGVVAALRASGCDLKILSGDTSEAVRPVAQELGIADWRAGQTPAAKIEVIGELRRAGRRVLMVGDGINDAPALAAATASMAPIAAADIAQASADAVFLGEGLAPVFQLLAAARLARRVMIENLGLAVLYNAFAVPLAVAGFVTPLIAAAAMSGSSILVVVNALRARAVPGLDRPAPERQSRQATMAVQQEVAA